MTMRFFVEYDIGPRGASTHHTAGPYPTWYEAEEHQTDIKSYRDVRKVWIRPEGHSDEEK